MIWLTSIGGQFLYHGTVRPRLRGNYENDKRSPSGFKVLSQEQWPEDFGNPSDWR